MGGWGPERLSHESRLKPAPRPWVLNLSRKGFYTNCPCGALFHLVRAQGGKGYLRLQAGVSLVRWGNLGPRSPQDSLLRAKELIRTPREGGTWGFRKGRQDVREFKMMP